MKAAIDAVPYAPVGQDRAADSSAGSGKKTRRSTAASATPICRSGSIGYPCTGFNGGRPAACCSAPILFEAPTRSNSPRCRRPSGSRARSNSASRIHPQYKAEFENGVAVAWHRVPFDAGLLPADWTEQARAAALRRSLPIDGRIVLAGEHASYHSGVAGRRDPFLARCDRAAASSRRRRMSSRSALCLLAAGLLVATEAPAQQAETFANPAHFAATDGAALYRDICQGCHMARGQGAKGAGAYPALAKDANLAAARLPGADRAGRAQRHAWLRRDAGRRASRSRGQLRAREFRQRL